jgi:plasmid stabilization system protein ParE
MEDMLTEFREWPISFGAGGYVIFYYYDKASITILNVKHNRELGYC